MRSKSNQTANLIIDARGLTCPLPLLKAKQGLNQLTVGQILEITATDPGSVRDFHSFTDLTDNSLIGFVESDGQYTYVLKKGS